MCHEIIPGSSNGGFSVVKHILYSLEIALYCYKELRRNVLDFWSRFQTEKPPKTAHFTIACTICDLHKKQTEFPRGRDAILVPRGRAPFGQHQESRPLAKSNTGSPRFTDFPSLCACSESSLTNLIGSGLNLLCLQSHSKTECRWTRPEVAILGADQNERGL